MKDSDESEIKVEYQSTDFFKNHSLGILINPIEQYERERKILLDLSNDITRVREKMT